MPARSETCSDVLSVCYLSFSQVNNFDELEDVQITLLCNKQMVVYLTLMRALHMQELHESITTHHMSMCSMICLVVFVST